MQHRTIIFNLIATIASQPTFALTPDTCLAQKKQISILWRSVRSITNAVGRQWSELGKETCNDSIHYILLLVLFQYNSIFFLAKNKVNIIMTQGSNWKWLYSGCRNRGNYVFVPPHTLFWKIFKIKPLYLYILSS